MYLDAFSFWLVDYSAQHNRPPTKSETWRAAAAELALYQQFVESEGLMAKFEVFRLRQKEGRP